MKADHVIGRPIRWTFTDGTKASGTFEYVFDADGTVTWHSVSNARGGATPKHNPGPAPRPVPYQFVTVGQNACALTYLSAPGTTLTVLLDLSSHLLTAFSSNETELMLQHGTFEVLEPVTPTTLPPDARPTAP